MMKKRLSCRGCDHLHGIVSEDYFMAGCNCNFWEGFRKIVLGSDILRPNTCDIDEQINGKKLFIELKKLLTKYKRKNDVVPVEEIKKLIEKIKCN